MRKSILILLTAISVLSAQAPVYLNIGSHNESNDSTYPGHAYMSQASHYNSIKSFVLELSDSVAANGAKWNMMLEANMVRACIKHDTAVISNNDLIQWADAQTHIEVDPHNHFLNLANPYNYTDLNYLLTQCGIGVRNNMGGFLYKTLTGTGPCGALTATEDWTPYRDTVDGFQYPFARWRPRMLWGGGTPGHCDDNAVLGFWAPTDSTAVGFNTHDQYSDLPNNGSSCGEDFAIFDTSNATHVINHVIDIINYAQTYGGSNDFYTLTVMFNFRHSNSPGFSAKISQVMRAMQPYVANGSVVWMTLSEKYDEWYSNHSATQSFLQPCYNMGIGLEPNNISNLVSVFPNPVDEDVYIRVPYEYTQSSYEWIDLSGKVVSSGLILNNLISAKTLSNGFYTLRLYMDDNYAIKKVMVQH